MNAILKGNPRGKQPKALRMLFLTVPPGGATMGEIFEWANLRLKMCRTTASVQLGRLVKAGLVRRERQFYFNVSV